IYRIERGVGAEERAGRRGYINVRELIFPREAADDVVEFGRLVIEIVVEGGQKQRASADVRNADDVYLRFRLFRERFQDGPVVLLEFRGGHFPVVYVVDAHKKRDDVGLRGKRGGQTRNHILSLRARPGKILQFDRGLSREQLRKQIRVGLRIVVPPAPRRKAVTERHIYLPRPRRGIPHRIEMLGVGESQARRPYRAVDVDVGEKEESQGRNQKSDKSHYVKALAHQNLQYISMRRGRDSVTHTFLLKSCATPTRPVGLRPSNLVLPTKETTTRGALSSDAERERFELSMGCPMPVFETGALDHSATSPLDEPCGPPLRHDAFAAFSAEQREAPLP